MKRKRGRKSGTKTSSKADTSDASRSSPSSPSTEENIPAESAPVSDSSPAVAEPAPPPEPPKASVSVVPLPVAAPAANPAAADIPYAKPKVGVVYGRVKLKFKSSKALEPNHSLSEAKAPADAGKSQAAAAAEGSKQVVAEKVVAASSDGQTADVQASELSGSDDKDKLAKKVASVKILSAGLSSSVQDNTQDRKTDLVDEPPPSNKEIVLVDDESVGASEPRNLHELEGNQSTLERQRDEKELAAALVAIKKVMKVDAAEPFNIPVNPVAMNVPDYLDVIDTPMDFGTIRQDLERGNKYMNSEDVYRDVQFIWNNCTKYNSKGDYVVELMKRVKKAFMKTWLAAGLYSDVQDNGGNDNTGDEAVKGSSKSKSKQKRRRPGNDRHKNDCGCAVCQVTRRKKERDETLSVDNETIVVNDDISEEQNMEVNFGVNNPGSHDTPSSQEQSQHTNVYKPTVEADVAQTQMEDLGKFLNNPSLDHEDQGSRQYSEEKEEEEYKDLNSQGEHTSTQPNDNSELEHHQQKAQTETSREVEMEDFPIQQENQSFLQLCARLFPSKQTSAFRGRHSLFCQQRRAAPKESPLHAAMTAIMKG